MAYEKQNKSYNSNRNNSSSANDVKAIYALRRKFKETNDQSIIEEAMEKASELVQNPQAGKFEWTAYGYCLVSLFFSPHRNKQDKEYNDYLYESAHTLVENMERIFGKDPFLVWAQEDEFSQKQATYIRRILDECAPTLEQASLLKQAQIKSKEKDYALACQLYLQASEQQLIFSNYDENNFGWSLYYHGRDLLKESEIELPTVSKYLNQYLKLKQIDKPCTLNSCMLRLADSFYSAHPQHFSLIDYVHKFDLSTLSDEDFKPRVVDENEYDGMVCNVLCHAAKSLFETRNEKAKDLIPLIKEIEPYFDKAQEHNLNKVGWLYYYHARLLRFLKREKSACLLSIWALEHLSEYSPLWMLMGDICSQSTDIAYLKIAAGCYIHAMVHHKANTTIAPSTHLLLGELLYKIGEKDAAYNEICHGYKGYQDQNKAIPNTYKTIVEAQWFKEYDSDIEQQIALSESLFEQNGGWNNLSHIANFQDLYDELYTLSHQKTKDENLAAKFVDQEDREQAKEENASGPYVSTLNNLAANNAQQSAYSPASNNINTNITQTIKQADINQADIDKTDVTQADIDKTDVTQAINNQADINQANQDTAYESYMGYEYNSVDNTTNVDSFIGEDTIPEMPADFRQENAEWLETIAHQSPIENYQDNYFVGENTNSQSFDIPEHIREFSSLAQEQNLDYQQKLANVGQQVKEMLEQNQNTDTKDMVKKLNSQNIKNDIAQDDDEIPF